MRTLRHLGLVIVLLTAFCFSQQNAPASAVVPQQIVYSSLLKDGAGKLVKAVSGVTFLIYKDEQGGAPLWLETQSVTPDSTGHYSVQLGATSAKGIPSDIFQNGEARWLAVQIVNEPEQPRVLLVAVPYAMKAVDAETLGGLPASAYVLAPKFAAVGAASTSARATSLPESSAIKADAPANKAAKALPPGLVDVTTNAGGGVVGTLPMFSTATNVQSSNISDVNGSIGIGTTTPKARLDVEAKAAGGTAPTLWLKNTAAIQTGTPGNSTDIRFSPDSGGAVGAPNAYIRAQESGNGLYSTSLAFGTIAQGSSSPAERMRISPTGQVGIGTSSPTVALQVSGSDTTGTGIQSVAVNNAKTTNSFAVLAAETAPGVTAEMVADGLGTGPLGVPSGYFGTYTNQPIGFITGNKVQMSLGSNGATIGATAGGNAQLAVQSQLSSRVAIFAEGYTSGANSGGGGQTSFSTVGGSADPNSAEDGATGVYSNGGTGGQGGLDGQGGYFVGGIGATSIGGGDGIFASAGSGVAGNFAGDVTVSGNLSKSGGSFKIDHPLYPANKYLYHSFVESPDMMNIYNGNVVTDAGGDAVITMPAWFSVLNRDFRYQLTVIGQFAQAMVARKLEHNQFAIKTSLPNVEVSWQITGIRQDAWANAHRIPVEQEKNPRERGLYLHPELYGAPEDKQINWARHTKMMNQMREQRMLMEQKPKNARPASSSQHASLAAPVTPIN